MKKIRKTIIIMMLVSIMFITKCYAISLSKELDIVKLATVGLQQTNFKVRFSGEPKVSNADKVTAYISTDMDATINVIGLTMNENIETVTYVVQNTSTDLSAKFDVEIVNSNKEYFNIDVDVQKSTLTKGEATKVTVKIELIKAPIRETEKTMIGIQLKATPIQPTENNTLKPTIDNQNSNTNTNSNQYDYNEKDDTPKTGIWKFRDIFWR